MHGMTARPPMPPRVATPGERMLAYLDAAPYRWVLVYTLFAGLAGWVSERFLLGAPRQAHLMAMVKQGAFVLISAGLLYLLLRREVRVLKAINQTLEEERAFNQALFQSLSEGIVALDRQGGTCVFNRAAQGLLGASGGGAEGRLFAADGRTPLSGTEDPLARARRGEVAHDLELVLRSRGSHPRVLLAQVDPIRRPDGQVLGSVVAFLDVTETRFYAHKAFHDPLTDLPNRALLQDRLAQALKSLERRPRVLALLFLDLNGFKGVNDRLGHGAGDQLLVETGGRLTECLRPEDTLARLGGDEFILLLDEIEDEMAALKVAHRMVELVSRPFDLEGGVVAITASVGVALTQVPMPPDQLLHQADMAMYAAKRDPEKRFKLFVPGDPEFRPRES